MPISEPPSEGSYGDFQKYTCGGIKLFHAEMGRMRALEEIFSVGGPENADLCAILALKHGKIRSRGANLISKRMRPTAVGNYWILCKMQGKKGNEGRAGCHHEEWQERANWNMRGLRDEDVQDRGRRRRKGQKVWRQEKVERQEKKIISMRGSRHVLGTFFMFHFVCAYALHK